MILHFAFVMNYIFFEGNATSLQSMVESKPSRRTFNFRMLVRGKDGEPSGNEDVFCVGYIDQWTKKEAEHQKQRKIF